ncbi:TetR/AcrR family transcriptional regulator [uncultured Massilia sp.]|uniref:TetR/AcrR family transcriptional regulator n=1 Tax=uncultured Massilia sp. TaxID=169973 RepID=UPI0025E5A7E5|nr:TetR/AcrR family transcriptional regulator [uncultured Massilia sp.]
MRYSSNHKAETRKRIIGEASRRFRKNGIEGTGLVPLMKALGLTHGGFYAHFTSKDALVQASLEAAVGDMLARWPDPRNGEELRAFVDDYLSAQHRDNPGEGCPLTSLGVELGLRGTPSSTSDAMVARMAERLAGSEVRAAAPQQGMVALAAMVGAIALARAVSDPATSDGILDAVRAAIQPPADEG